MQVTRFLQVGGIQLLHRRTISRGGQSVAPTLPPEPVRFIHIEYLVPVKSLFFYWTVFEKKGDEAQGSEKWCQRFRMSAFCLTANRGRPYWLNGERCIYTLKVIKALYITPSVSASSGSPRSSSLPLHYVHMRGLPFLVSGEDIVKVKTKMLQPVGLLNVRTCL